MDLFRVFEEPVETEKPAAAGPPKAETQLKEEKVKNKRAAGSPPSSKRAKPDTPPPAEETPKLEKPKVTDEVEITSTQQIKEGSVVEELRHQVRHDVALPPNYDYTPIQQHVPSANPARTYPFTLDPFQRLSVNAIERNESVLVSAHTSAGKTVVAEYAIAQCLRARQRVIYTSPIKALSNQKYRELLADFGDVGLLTGDVTINPDASCLVMTTEILRSMLYRGSEVMREVAWVVFDEIHYMRDLERGVVWEEAIILLPDNVRHVFLSATIPNAMQFAEWICEIHSQPCHVVYTNFRPTPLQHYLFPEGGQNLMLVVDAKGHFREQNFSKAMTSLKEREQQGKRDGNGNPKQRKRTASDDKDIFRIMKVIQDLDLNPVIVFSFSKRECENLALKLARLDFNTSEEHQMVTKVFNNAMDQLSEQDRQLPQIQKILPLLKRGIGVHHSGLLPILKEVIELLFQEGLLKCLFATETFSIGLNMPAKTVIFTSVRKFDGTKTRWITGGEYIQMSGRAGRRGLDDKGVVIMMINEQMEPSIAKNMVLGVADPLNSAFHLGYNMILNLLRVEGISPEYMLDRCFFKFQNAQKVPELRKEHRELLKKADEIDLGEQETSISEYWHLRRKIAEYGVDISKVISHPGNCLKFLNPGRLVKVKYENRLDFGWGVLCSITKRGKPRNNKEKFTDHEKYLVEVLVLASESTPMSLMRKFAPKLVPGVEPAKDEAHGKPIVIPFTLDSIVEISQLRLRMPEHIQDFKSRNALLRMMQKSLQRFPNERPPLLDPIEDMHIKDKNFLDLVRKVEVLELKCSENEVAKSDSLPELYSKFDDKQKLIAEAGELDEKIKQAQAILQMDELKARKRVLRKLGFCSATDIVDLKGRVACEISSGDELVLTELIFDGTFGNLEPEQIAALLSCFVFDERAEAKGSMHPSLRAPLQALMATAKRIAQVSIESKLPLVESEYLQRFKPELMDVVYQWARGATFAQICKLTNTFEGSLIRTFRRLEELIRQMASAAAIINNDELVAKMNKALELIQRDLVSAASLYL